jgi:hypothetical protein
VKQIRLIEVDGVRRAICYPDPDFMYRLGESLTAKFAVLSWPMWDKLTQLRVELDSMGFSTCEITNKHVTTEVNSYG